MKKLLYILFVLVLVLVLVVSCKSGTNPIADNPVSLVDKRIKLNVVVQDNSQAGILTLLSGETEIASGEVAEFNAREVLLPLGTKEVTAIISQSIEEPKAVLWYGSAVGDLTETEVKEANVTFEITNNSILGLYISSGTSFSPVTTTINFNPAEGSIVVFGKTNETSKAEYKYPEGFILTIEAEPKDNYIFLHWDGGVMNGTYYDEKWNYTVPRLGKSYTAKFENVEAEEPTKTSGEWILIEKASHLRWLAKEVNNGNKVAASGKYKLMNNIDYSTATGNSLHIPIGVYNNYLPDSSLGFSGVINGNNKYIQNAKYASVSPDGESIISSGQMAFVGYLAQDGVISNLRIDSSTVIDSTTTKTTYTAGIVAVSVGAIYNSANNTVVIAGGSHAGGIVSFIAGDVSSSTKPPIIRNVYNGGNIKLTANDVGGEAYIGGIVGYSTAPKTVIVNAYAVSSSSSSSLLINTGNTTTTKVYTGGVIGKINAPKQSTYITNVYFKGNFSVASTHVGNTGGIIGSYVKDTEPTFKNMYFMNDGGYTTGLPTHGYSQNNNIQDTVADKTLTAGTLKTLHTTFNLATPNTWTYSTVVYRPYIKGVERD